MLMTEPFLIVFFVKVLTFWAPTKLSGYGPHCADLCRNSRVGKAHLPGGKLVHLESQWTPYLADLEAGSITSPDLLLTECAERQDSWIATAPRHLELGMLQEAKKEKEKVSQKGKENWTKTTSPSQKEKENNLRMVASTVERQDIANQECWQNQQDEAKGVRQVKAPASSPRPQQDPQLHK